MNYDFPFTFDFYFILFTHSIIQTKILYLIFEFFIYFIFQGANQQSKCIECKAIVGGQGHALAAGNSHAGNFFIFNIF